MQLPMGNQQQIARAQGIGFAFNGVFYLTAAEKHQLVKGVKVPVYLERL